MYRRQFAPRSGTSPRRPLPLHAEEAPVDTFSPGALVLAQDVVARNVFVLGDGIFELVHQLSDGRRTLVGLRGRGSVVGAESALARQPQPVALVAVTACSAVRIAASRFACLIREQGDFATWVLTARFEELEKQVMQSVSLARFSARERLEAYLDFCAESSRGRSKNRGSVELPLKDRELAQFIAVTPSYLSRLMGEMQKQGRVVREGRRTRYLQSAPAPV